MSNKVVSNYYIFPLLLPKVNTGITIILLLSRMRITINYQHFLYIFTIFNLLNNIHSLSKEFIN